ncbi:unnamed protein product [Nezara viridula]|uniref:Uncharacterized protein n=1 Tax=Nezara viridula TaxID=85310 RepID=A0A9P0MI67_NEZVI|nr:unnamed protein product [Nezara viridula]
MCKIKICEASIMSVLAPSEDNVNIGK